MGDESVEKNTSENRKKTASFFSIVIPLWNREDCIKRCLDSIFAQDFDDYEVVVVDDCSEDNSLKIVESYSDPRLRVVRHKENRGVCAARNTGTSTAVGKWIVSLDTDWVLLPAALKFLAEMASEATPDIGVIGGYAISDTGATTPEKPFPTGPFGFVEYLKWLDLPGTTDYQPCRRKEVFDTVAWPTDRRLETQFHMHVARRWKMWICAEVIAVTHTDCANRFTSDDSVEGLRRRISMAHFIAVDSEEIVKEFGSELLCYAPNQYFRILYRACYHYFWAGKRLRGLRFGVKALLRKPWAIQIPGIMVVGLLGPNAMSKVRKWPVLKSIYRTFYRFSFRKSKTIVLL